MILFKGGTKFELVGKNIKVAATLSIEKTPLGGSTSSTDDAEAGIKPQRLAVSLQIPWEQEKELKRLKQVVIDRDLDGNAVIYSIVDRLAEAMDIRQVRFADSFSVTETDGVLAWNVSFALEEFRSVSERREDREQPNEVMAVKGDGVVIKPEGSAISKLQQFMSTGERAFA